MSEEVGAIPADASAKTARRARKSHGKVGRPSKYSDQKAELIVKAVRAGNFVETAAALAGLSKQTVYGWIRAGARSRKGKLRDFWTQIREAQAFAEARDLQELATAGANDWRARAWRLERRFGKRWAESRRVEAKVTGDARKPIGITGGLVIEVVEARKVNPETGEVAE